MRPGPSRRDIIAKAMAASGMFAIMPRAARAGSASPQCPSVASPPTVAPPFSGTPLGTIAAGKNLALGIQLDVADNQAYGAGMYDPVYRQVVFRERPAFVAYGSAFKFGTVCPDPPSRDGSLTFTQAAYGVTDTWYQADDLTGFIKGRTSHGRADALIWNVAGTAPPWLKPISPDATAGSPALAYNLSFIPKYMSAAFRKMTQLQAGQADFFSAVGLINEPIVPDFENPASPGPATYRDGPWLPPGQRVADTPGVPAYIHRAFVAAEFYRTYWARALRQPATTAKFFINETLCETDQFGPTMRPALLMLLERMLRAGLNIQAVGLECHLQPQMMNDAYHPDWTSFGAFIQAIGKLGLDVHVTELDVLDYETSCFGTAGSTAASDGLIDVYYGSFLRTVLSHANVKAITLWDLSDRYTFYRYLDEAAWYGYDAIPRPKPADTPWPNCPTLPAPATAIACPRPDAYDDAMNPKPARQAIVNALRAAPVR